jgi:demethylmenaquinone methyltransferase / 2-methoxy-6-polyprenyl-1,4-benzoquinol methylase
MTISQEQSRPLKKMFSVVPPSYDILNRILTLGADAGWRKSATRQILRNNPSQVLDLCCGTGDLLLEVKKKAGKDVTIKALDFSAPMLDIAKKKLSRKGMNAVELILGDAANMPFQDNSFDSIGISFGFRNLTFENPDREIFLKEILRVLRPGGQLVIVETSQPSNLIWRKLYHYYMSWFTAPIGGVLSGQRSAYQYLAYSARNFYSPAQMRELLLDAGFSQVNSEALMGGISAITTAVK